MDLKGFRNNNKKAYLEEKKLYYVYDNALVFGMVKNIQQLSTYEIIYIYLYKT